MVVYGIVVVCEWKGEGDGCWGLALNVGWSPRRVWGRARVKLPGVRAKVVVGGWNKSWDSDGSGYRVYQLLRLHSLSPCYVPVLMYDFHQHRKTVCFTVDDLNFWPSLNMHLLNRTTSINSHRRSDSKLEQSD